jgi:hypothetical protein
MEATEVRQGYELWRPNREKAQSKSMKALIAFVLLVSAGMVFVITIGGWERLQGPSVGAMSLIYAGIYVPVASALAVILAIFAAIAGPAWFDRSKDGLSGPALPDDLLGLLCLLLVPVQLILIVVSMIGFNQNWHVEEERPIGGVPLHGEDEDDTGPEPAPA